MTRRQIYERNISDTAMEISISRPWREKIFKLKKGEQLTISAERAEELPAYIKDEIVTHRLTYCVGLAEDCPEEFDDGLIVFEFRAEEYPDIVRYSGNNPGVL